MIKCCIFDLDGTLLDTLPTIKHHLNLTLQKYGYQSVSDEQTKCYIGDGAYHLIYRALREQGMSDEDVIATILRDYMASYESAPLHLTRIYDGIPEMLSELASRGVTLAVLSNKPDVAARMVVEHYFPGVFSLVYGNRTGVPLKPDPAAPLAMLDELGFECCESAFVGDTAVDIMTGKNMSAALSVGVLWGFRDECELKAAGADLLAASPSDIVRGISDNA